jgi:hypothetical protein
MKNNKGFMLVEVVITSTVIITALMGLYVTFNKLYNLYNVRDSYFDIDGVYAIKGIINYLIDTDRLNYVANKVNENMQYNIIDVDDNNLGGGCSSVIDSDIDSDIDWVDYCANVKATYNIQKFLVVKKSKDQLEEIKKANINQTFYDYLSYIEDYYVFDDNIDNIDNIQYLVIVEYKSGDKYNYSSLEVS